MYTNPEHSTIRIGLAQVLEIMTVRSCFSLFDWTELAVRIIVRVYVNVRVSSCFNTNENSWILYGFGVYLARKM